MSFYVFDLSDVRMDKIIFWIFAAVLVYIYFSIVIKQHSQAYTGNWKHISK